MHFTPQAIWASTTLPVKIVLLTMLIMAIWCIYVAIERGLAYKKAEAQSRALAEAVTGALGKGDIGGALALTQAEEYEFAYLGALLRAGLTEFHARPDRDGIQAVERALDRVSIDESTALKKGFNLLASTGATAPFVGLVGTIFGIINAFQGMGESGGGDLAAISTGIAEALVATAIGITVALIGVWLFNYFNARAEKITNDMAIASEILVDWCEKHILPPFEKTAK
jgi:biopolymer transport protein ExbB/TolQ